MSDNPLAPAWLREPGDVNALSDRIWPASACRRDDGSLEVGGIAASELAERFGTPLYVVDEDDFRARAVRVKTAFDAAFGRIGSAVHVYYAGKAFLTTHVVRWMADAGLNVDVCTGGELEVALAGGIDPSRIGFHGNDKTDAEIARAVAVGVGTIVADSHEEISRIAREAAAAGVVQRVRMRINSGVHASTHEYLATAREDQKFGIPLAEASRAAAEIRAERSLTFAGLHSHIGSQIFDAAGFREAARRLMDVHAELLTSGPVPELNLGGGWGIDYTEADTALGPQQLADDLAAIVAETCAERGIPVPAIAVEPGRYIAGPPGITLYRVGTIKPVELLADGDVTATRTYISVDGGMSDNPRPALYGADYTSALARTSDAAPMLARVVGRHCESGDIVVKDDYLPEDARRDDLLAVAVTGAYCWSLSSNYNYVGRPPVVSVAGGQARILVRGETVQDLLARDTGVAG